MAELIELIVRGVLLGVVYGLIAIPITLVYATTDVVDLAVGGYATLGGVLAAVVGGVAGVFVGIGAAILAASVVGVFFLLVARRGTPDPITVVLATFALATALGSLVLWQWGRDPFVERLFDNFLNVGGIRFSPQGIVNVGVAAVLLLVLYLVVYRTSLGRAMRASAVNARAASLAGIPVRRVQFLTFLVGGALAGVGGVLILYTTGLDFTVGLNLVLVAVSAAVLFGMDSPLLGFAGGVVIGIVEAVASGYLSGAIASVIPMALILVLLASGRMGRISAVEARA